MATKRGMARVFNLPSEQYEKLRMGATTVRVTPARCCETGCKGEPLVMCGYRLRGHLDGTACSRALCADHQTVIAGVPLCRAHVRLTVRR